jgi:hypothetical protein
MPLGKRDDTHEGMKFASPFFGVQGISATQQAKAQYIADK